jgi:hypothetical protein
MRLTSDPGGESAARILNEAKEIGRLEAMGENPASHAKFAESAAKLQRLNIMALGREYKFTSRSRTQITPKKKPKRRKTRQT